jgi:hypothetical protein
MFSPLVRIYQSNFYVYFSSPTCSRPLFTNQISMCISLLLHVLAPCSCLPIKILCVFLFSYMFSTLVRVYQSKFYVYFSSPTCSRPLFVFTNQNSMCISLLLHVLGLLDTYVINFSRKSQIFKFQLLKFLRLKGDGQFSFSAQYSGTSSAWTLCLHYMLKLSSYHIYTLFRFTKYVHTFISILYYNASFVRMSSVYIHILQAVYRVLQKKWIFKFYLNFSTKEI